MQRISRVDLVRVKYSEKKKVSFAEADGQGKEPGGGSGAEGGVVEVSGLPASALVDGVDIGESSLGIGETSVGSH